MKEYYEILGLKDGASIEEIKVAFRKLSQKTHPDKGGSEYLFKIINGAYQELLNSFKKGKAKNVEINFILLPSSEKKNVDSNKIVDQICTEIFNTFKSLNYNPFTVGIKLKYLFIVVRKYNSSQFVLSNNLYKIGLSSVFTFKTSYDLCKHICEQYGINTKQHGFESGIRQILIKLAAKDIIDKNGGVAFNDGGKANIKNQNETIDIKDHKKNINNNRIRNNPSNNRLRSMFSGKSYKKIDKNDISHTSKTDIILNIIFFIGLGFLIIKLIGMIVY